MRVKLGKTTPRHLLDQSAQAQVAPLTLAIAPPHDGPGAMVLAFNKAITQVSIRVRNLSSNVYKRRHKKQIACSDYFSFVPRIAFCHKTYTHDDDVYHLMRPCFHLPVTRKSNTPFSLLIAPNIRRSKS